MCPTSGDHTVKVVGDKMSVKIGDDTVPIEHYRLSQRQTAQLDLENTRLTTQLREVIGMNTRWQKYDQQRETYVLKLHSTIKDLNARLSAKAKELEKLMEQQSREKLREERPDISDLTSGLKAAKLSEQTTPMCALDAKFARKEKELLTLQDEMERLEEQVRSLQRNETRIRQEGEEKVSIFKAQLEVCMEDFRLERSDRQRMHDERLRLRKQLDDAEMTIARLHEEISVLVEETRWLQDRPSRLTHHYGEPTVLLPTPRYRYNYYTRANTNQGRRGVARVKGADYPDYDSNNGFPSDVTIDGVPESLEPPSPSRPKCASAPASLNQKRENLSRTFSFGSGDEEASVLDEEDGAKALRCPQCLDKFTVKEHDSFLEHTEICCGPPTSSDSC